ncbi:uncharacterized protein A1O5_05677 [Cladophialophora psammophila CBS 110553]|uniref:INO80 complex subunit Ies4 n=1 Tax=Cladophialophora psammophila CBS 110553 TaxID=1182543 RepID=W9WR44_9EURO|nr:uncharacterized protein A1O5_05677 [Cladophialophora psammophila CBS 110553]EXJ70687.1 hypothetical protein A1O5_05677 [Cladophialophora psammophila CBS 110553]
MSSSSTTGRSPSASAKADKNKKQVKIVILKLSPKILRRFEDPPAHSEEQATPSSASSPPAAVEETSTLKVPEVNDNASEAASTPAPTPGDAADTSNGDGSKKRKGGSLAGIKRSLGQMFDVNGLPKPRGKPGPKKKPRLEDGTIDHGAAKGSTMAGIAAGHKLGPKANQGAINAGLRALDRSGKPCRKWSKKPFILKSFTGVVWELDSWRGTERPQVLNSEESSDTKEISQQSSSDIKLNESDVAMESNAGDQADPMLMSTPAASSPAPMPPSSAAIAAQG